ncbi:MAG TPA: hypothetical protein VNW71_06670 [Thermoanaerobaculia bacterium]|nr:hypothetical protein [Thermoanaerobaculia bacterium]
MSTPTTVKFQIAVSSTDGNGQAIEKVFLVDMSVESGSGKVLGIELVPSTTLVSGSNDNGSIGDGKAQPSGEVMPPKDPPTVAISIAA